MTRIDQLARQQLEDLGRTVDARYEAFQKRGLELDLTRGKPSAEQLDLSAELLDGLGGDFRAEDGTDCRNYGGLEGLPEAKRLFAPMLGVAPDDILVGGNASLALMNEVIVEALLRGVPGGTGPWKSNARTAVICPVPGYDRHFNLCEHVGLELIPVPMTEDGPDMDRVEELVATDPDVRAIWCVPRFSNPTGITYSDEVVGRLAAMKTAAPDFRILCDNAYAVHVFEEPAPPLRNVLDACRSAGHPDRVILFGSTSKITFAGAGVAMVAGSEANVAWLRRALSMHMIGPDKLNQLRHVRFFADLGSIEAHMRRHAEILRPKFHAVQEILDRELRSAGVATWTRPHGGYFVSVDTEEGMASEIVAMAGEAGVRLTPAGATWPGGRDPHDRNIRLAPTMPTVDEVRAATEVFAICILRTAITRRLAT